MSETEEVERVREAMERLCGYAVTHGLGYTDTTAPRVLAAIRAAASHLSTSSNPRVRQAEALDAALAALTDHPGGTDT